MAVEPTDAALDRRVLDSLPRAEVEVRRPSSVWSAPRRSLALGLAALVLTVTAVAGVAGFFFRSYGGGDFPLDGRTWSYRSDFHGEVTFRDAQGRRVGGSVTNLDGWPGRGEVDVDVQGRHYHFNTPGEHPVRDAEGRLLGSAVLRVISPEEARERTLKSLERYGIQRIPETPEEVRAVRQKVMNQDWDTWGIEKKTGIRGASASPLGVLGFDNELDVYWKVRGFVSVTALDAEGKQVGGGDTKRFGEPASETPEVTAIVAGKSTTVRGYGLHEIRNDQGQLLLMLKVEPLPRR